MGLVKNRSAIKPIITLAVAMGFSVVSSVAAAEEGTADPLTFMPKTQPYTPGMQIPTGYRLTEGPRKPLLISGAITFGVAYLPMAIFGIYGMATTNDSSAPLFLLPIVMPVVLPFAPIGTSGFGLLRTAFLVDGILQAAGIGLLIAGAVTRGKYLKREDIATMMPSVSVGPRFVGMQWSF